MERIADKTCALAACIACLLIAGELGPASVTCLLAAVIAISLVDITSPSQRLAALPPLGIVALACAWPQALFLLPLASYELVQRTRVRLVPTVALPLALALFTRTATPQAALLVAVASLLCAALSWRTSQALAAQQGIHQLRDDLQERLLDLQASQRQLETAREAATHTATLAERTRIARSVHDGVGHVITRAKLQVEALRVSHARESVAEELAAVSASLDEALYSMRASVHALEDRGQDLELGLRQLAQGAGIADVRLQANLDSTPPADVSRCLLDVCRESLTNAARHAHATQAEVRVTEYPGLWNMQVTNDGTMPEGGQLREGMGIRTMRERVAALGGTVALSWDSRFRVFASLPRKEVRP